MKQDFISDNPQLIQALRQAQNEKTDVLLEASKSSTYIASADFRRKMERLIREQSKSYYKFINTRPKKALLAFAAVFILMISLVFSVSALREPVVKFFVEVYEKFSTVFFRPSEEASPPTTLEVIYEPSWLPEGYVLEDDMSMEDDLTRDIFYFNNSDMIAFSQYTLATGLVVDTEAAEVRTETIRGREAILYKNKGWWNLLWDDGQYGFLLVGPVSDDEILRIAESLKEK